MENKVVILTTDEGEVIAAAKNFNHILKYLIVKGFHSFTPMELYYDDGEKTMAEWLEIDEKASAEEVSQTIDKLTDDTIKNIIRAFDYSYSVEEVL